MHELQRNKYCRAKHSKQQKEDSCQTKAKISRIIHSRSLGQVALDSEITGNIIKIEPVREKTNNLDFRPGLTQTGLYNHRKRLDA